MKYVQYTNTVTSQVIDFEETIDGITEGNVSNLSDEVLTRLRYANGQNVGSWVCTEVMVF